MRSFEYADQSTSRGGIYSSCGKSRFRDKQRNLTVHHVYKP